jgi:hypothetical protein
VPKYAEPYYPCAVCRYGDLGEPLYVEGRPTWLICPCCGTQFGYEDAIANHNERRGRWIGEGMKWWSRYNRPPPDWNPLKQLAGLTLRGRW